MCPSMITIFWSDHISAKSDSTRGSYLSDEANEEKKSYNVVSIVQGEYGVWQRKWQTGNWLSYLRSKILSWNSSNLLHNSVRSRQEGREAKLETGFLFGCVLYRMLYGFQFVPCRCMGFCTAFAILDTGPRTKLEWGISSPFLPGSHLVFARPVRRNKLITRPGAGVKKKKN
jgi:hypothetical protein